MVVKFNVGGVKDRCATTLATLRQSSTHFPDSVFAWLFEGEAWRDALDSEGCYFIDRNVSLFEEVLDLLRHPDAAPRVSFNRSNAGWEKELAHWGLTQPQLQRKKAKLDTGMYELARMGEQLRQRASQNDANVIALILKNCDVLGEDRLLSRPLRLYVPAHAIVFGAAVTASMYIAANWDGMQKLFDSVIGAYMASKKLIEPSDTALPLTYTYDKEVYNTYETATHEITLDFRF